MDRIRGCRAIQDLFVVLLLGLSIPTTSRAAFDCNRAQQQQNQPQASTSNPLLDRGGPIPWDRVQPEHFYPALEQSLAELNAVVDRIVRMRRAPTFDNAVLPFLEASDRLEDILLVYWDYLSSKATEPVVQTKQKVRELLKDWPTSAYANPAFMTKIKQVSEDLHRQRESLFRKKRGEEAYAIVRGREKEAADLEEKKMTTDKIVAEDVKQRGEKLEKHKQNLLRAEELESLFDANASLIEKSTRLIVTDVRELEGLSAERIAQARELGGAEGRWVLPMKDHSLLEEIYEFAPEPLRKKAFYALEPQEVSSNFISAEEAGAAWTVNNANVIDELIAVRKEIAAFHGKKTFAGFALQDSLSGTPRRVHQFLDTLKARVIPKMHGEVRMLTAFARTLDPTITRINEWDWKYYARLLKTQRFGDLAARMKEYFELETVIQGTLEYVGNIFRIRFKKIENAPSIDPSVGVYEVYDLKDNTLRGIIHMDLEARDQKTNWAWMQALAYRTTVGGSVRLPVVKIASNITRASANGPVLLRPWDVATFAHELGHALSELLSDRAYSMLTVLGTSADWVEFASQAIEYLVYRPDFLENVAVHYQTGEKMPAEMIRQLREINRLTVGLDKLRVLRNSELDLAWHEDIRQPGESVTDFEARVLKPLTIFPRPFPVSFSRRFTHSFSMGYAGTYNGYLWSEMAAKIAEEKRTSDAARIEELNDGLRAIFSWAGQFDGTALLKEYAGKGYDPRAWLRYYGFAL